MRVSRSPPGQTMPNPRKTRPACTFCGKEVSRPDGKFCNQHRQFEQEYIEYIARWMSGEETGNRAVTGIISNHIRRYLFEKYDHKCAQCGWSKRHPISGRLPLTVEHIDGNGYNNAEENLTLLCPNCQGLTPTYGGYNRGKGRDARRRAGVV